MHITAQSGTSEEEFFFFFEVCTFEFDPVKLRPTLQLHGATTEAADPLHSGGSNQVSRCMGRRKKKEKKKLISDFGSLVSGWNSGTWSNIYISLFSPSLRE